MGTYWGQMRVMVTLQFSLDNGTLQGFFLVPQDPRSLKKYFCYFLFQGNDLKGKGSHRGDF